MARKKKVVEQPPVIAAPVEAPKVVDIEINVAADVPKSKSMDLYFKAGRIARVMGSPRYANPHDEGEIRDAWWAGWDNYNK